MEEKIDVTIGSVDMAFWLNVKENYATEVKTIKDTLRVSELGLESSTKKYEEAKAEWDKMK